MKGCRETREARAVTAKGLPRFRTGQKWAVYAKRFMLLYFLSLHPAPSEVLVREDRPEDPDDFRFVWKGTLDALKEGGMIKELIQEKRTIFRKFRLTAKGLRTVRRWRAPSV